MFNASITLPEHVLKQLIAEGLIHAGVSADATGVSISYDGTTSSDPRESGAGASASISTTLAGQKVSISKSQSEIAELVKTALKRRGYAAKSVSFHHDGGDGPRGGAHTYAYASVELPEVSNDLNGK